MAEPARNLPEEPSSEGNQSRLPQEDRGITRPSPSELRASEGVSSNNAGGSQGGYTDSTAGREGDGTENRSTFSKLRTGNQFNSGGGAKEGRPDERGSSSTTDTPSSFNRSGDNNGPIGTASLASATGGINPKNIKNFFWGSKSRRRNTVAGSITSILLGGGIFGLVITSGPAQLVQLSAILQRPFQSTNSASDNRFGRLVRSAGARDLGETRVGQLGRKFLRPTISKLQDLGIEFKTGALGTNKVNIDPKKLKASIPSLEGASTVEQQAILSDSFEGLTPGQFKPNGDGTFTIDSSKMNSRSLTALKSSVLRLLPGGKILTYIRGRTLSPYLGVDTLFHPLKRLSKDALKKLISPKADIAQEEDRQNNIDKEVAQKADTATIKDRVKEKLGDNVTKTIEKGLVATAVVCTLHGAVDDAVALNRAAIVLPAIAKATDLVAVGEQVKSGKDTTTQQVGSVEQSLTDSKGHSVWGARSMQALENHKLTGPDLPSDYAQAFNGNTTADGLKKKTEVKLFGADATGLACSTAGQAIQIAAGVGLLVLNFPDGETGMAAYVSANLAKGAAVAAMFGFLEHQLTNIVKDNAIVPKLLSGPLGGNIAAFGARAAANTVSSASGGVELANTATQAVVADTQREEDQQFRSESFFARIFNENDYRSLMGRLADSIKPSFTQNVASLSGSFLNMGSLLLNNFSSLVPHASAAAQPYNWGFPIVGIPDNLLNDPGMSNPYDNASQAMGILQGSSGQDYIGRALSCFGVNIDASTGNVTKGQPVDPNSQSYTDGHCGDTTDGVWRRIIMLVFDTSTIQAAACYAGDDQSCSDVGYGKQGGSSTSSGTGTGSGFPQVFTVKGTRIYDGSGKEFIPYGISIIDDLLKPGQTQYHAAVMAQIQAAANSWHANTIRLQVSEAFVENGAGSKGYNEANMKVLKEEVDAIESAGKVPVISDQNAFTNHQPGPTSSTTQFWKAVPGYFDSQGANNYTNIIFDIYNEPYADGSNWQQRMQGVVSEIRGESNGLRNNLLFVEGPTHTTTSLALLDQYPITGANLVFDYHHVDLNSPSSWQQAMGLNLKNKVAIVDGEWAQYAAPPGGECYSNAPANIPSYFNLLHDNHIGLIFWSLAPGAGTQTNNPTQVGSLLDSHFSTDASDYSQPNSFGGNYACSTAPGVLGQGAGAEVMSYFTSYGS